MNRREFTLVDNIILAIVIVVILAVGIPMVRDIEKLKAQEEIVQLDPWAVLEFRAKPEKKAFLEGDEIVIKCELGNPTGFPVGIPKALHLFTLLFADSNFFPVEHGVRPPLFGRPLAPGEIVKFDARFEVKAVGTHRFSALFGSRHSKTSGRGSYLYHYPNGLYERRHPDGVLHGRIHDKIQDHIRGLESGEFELSILALDNSKLPTFDEVLGEMITTYPEYAFTFTVDSSIKQEFLEIARNRIRIKKLAATNPSEVFEFHAVPAKSTFGEDEEILIHCKILNPTAHELALPRRVGTVCLVIGDTDYFAARNIYSIRGTIAAGAELDFDVTFRFDVCLNTDYRVAFTRSTLSQRRGRFSILPQDEEKRYGHGLGSKYKYGFLTHGEIRLQSNLFSLEVQANDGYMLIPFDKVMDQFERYDRAH